MRLVVRGGGPGPIFCRPLHRKRAGVASPTWDTRRQVGNEQLTALVRESFTECGILDVQKVATHSGKRTGVQLYDTLGMTDEWVRD